MRTTHFFTHLRLILLLAAGLGLAGSADVAGQGIPTGTRSRVIVEFRNAPDVRIITGSGGVARRQLTGMKAQVADLDTGRLTELASNPQVASIRPDHPVFPTL